MKNLFKLFTIMLLFVVMSSSCDKDRKENTSAKDEQEHTEQNQQQLNQVQPPPTITWSLERDNLIKRFKMMNDRSIVFYMYLFIEGQSQPIGYYQVNKVSSVNSQLTNPEQIMSSRYKREEYVLPSPAEDGSYGTNGDGVFGFTPEDIYIEHNLKYVVSSVPLSFREPVNKLTIISVKDQKSLKTLMNKIK